MQCRPSDRPHARLPRAPTVQALGGRTPEELRQTTDDDRCQPAKQYWPIRRASNKHWVLRQIGIIVSSETTMCEKENADT